MLHVIDTVMQVDSYSWMVVIALAVVCTAFVCSTLGNFLYSLIFLPAFMAGGLGGVAGFRAAEIMLLPERRISVIIESSIGMMAALVALLVIGRILLLLYGLTIRPERKGTRARAMLAR